MSGAYFLKYFYSPLVEQSKILKRISQVQETLATQHTKIYLADDQLILSGANLETAYFKNRQDRYIQVCIYRPEVLVLNNTLLFL